MTTAEHICQDVATRHAVTVSEIRGRYSGSGSSHIVNARHEAMALIRAKLRWSEPRIGKYFGGRHSTTVHHALSKFRDSQLELPPPLERVPSMRDMKSELDELRIRVQTLERLVSQGWGSRIPPPN